MISGLVVLAFLTAASPVLPQRPGIENLGAESVYVQANHFVYAVYESLRGEDLNGDGDLADQVLHVRDPATGEIKNLGLATPGIDPTRVVSGDAGVWFVVQVVESSQGADLNGDGDTEDEVVHVHNLLTGETSNLGLVGAAKSLQWDGLLIEVSESGQGSDLNGDGDIRDHVVHLHDVATGDTVNLGLTAVWTKSLSEDFGNRLVLQVFEFDQGQDLNRDGDLEDEVVFVHDPARGTTRNLGFAVVHYSWFSEVPSVLQLWILETGQAEDLNGDGDEEDWILVIHDLDTGEIINPGLAGGASVYPGGLVVIGVDEAEQSEDRNGDGDMQDRVLTLFDIPTERATHLGLAGSVLYVSRDQLVLRVSEAQQGGDFNGDGDTDDDVVQIHRLATGETTNLGLALIVKRGFARLIGERVVLTGSEAHQSADLNGDGDQDDGVLHVLDLSTGELINVGLSYSRSTVLGDRLLLDVDESAQGGDLNEDGDTRDTVLHVYDLGRGEFTSPRLAVDVDSVLVRGDWLVLRVAESAQGADLNGDGDLEDIGVIHLYHIDSGVTSNLRLATTGLSGSDSHLLLHVSESRQGDDLNGDGQIGGEVALVHEIATGQTINLRLAVSRMAMFDDWVVLSSVESRQGADLNGDGDTRDDVVHTYQLSTGITTNLEVAGAPIFVGGNWLVLRGLESEQSTDLNGDGDTVDSVVLVHDLDRHETTNLRLAGSPLSFYSLDDLLLLLRISEAEQRQDLNGDGDTEDQILHLLDFARWKPAFIRGEANADGGINLSDGLLILAWLLSDAEAPPCLDAADFDDSGEIDLADAVRLFGFLFSGEAPPPEPGIQCGSDRTEDRLDCRRFDPCADA